MKKITAAVIALILLLSFTACKRGNNDDGGVVYPSRTAAFYGNMGDNFWFDMNLTTNGYSYDFKQATNWTNVTTIEDHSDNSRDKYEIYDGSVIHEVNIAEEYYDTVINVRGQEFLFDGYTPEMFANPTSTAVESFKGTSYYCETFTSASTSGGAVTGRNKYYFDGDTLVGVEIIEAGKTVMVMDFRGYGSELPANVYLAVPSNFKPRNLVYEDSGIDFSDYWGDLQ